MTADKNTTRERNSRTDQPNITHGDDRSNPEFSDLTPKQQAITIALLEHPDDPVVKIATRVGVAQSYPSQVIDNHNEIFNELRDDLNASNSIVDVIERELSNKEIIEIVERGLLNGVDTELTEKYTTTTGSDDNRNTADQSKGSESSDMPVDRPVTTQRTFMSAVPHDGTSRNPDTHDRNPNPDRHNDDPESPQDSQTTEVDADTKPTRDGCYSENSGFSDSVCSGEELLQWYNALTKKQRVIVDTITKNPNETDTRIAEIVSRELPSGESVSRAYVSIIQSEDAAYVEALQNRRGGSRRKSESRDQDGPIRRHEAAEDNEGIVGTSEDQVTSQRSSIPVEELKRMRDRIAFSANVIEHEYALQQSTTSSDDRPPLSGTHVAGTVAFARRTLDEIDELIKSTKTA